MVEVVNDPRIKTLSMNQRETKSKEDHFAFTYCYGQIVQKYFERLCSFHEFITNYVSFHELFLLDENVINNSITMGKNFSVYQKLVLKTSVSYFCDISSSNVCWIKSLQRRSKQFTGCQWLYEITNVYSTPLVSSSFHPSNCRDVEFKI